MLTLKEQIQNLETILQDKKQNLSPEIEQICRREIERLKRELIAINRAK